VLTDRKKKKGMKRWDGHLCCKEVRGKGDCSAKEWKENVKEAFTILMGGGRGGKGSFAFLH
jgi:hypothetical protein